MPASVKDYAHIHDILTAPISRKYDCGRYCAPLNNGEPVCCSAQNAVPVAAKTEWKLLKSKTDLWHGFKPYDRHTRKIVDELAPSCKAIECKGARFCERENRTLACRAFPFFPYFVNKKDMVGLSIYWEFLDRCWLLSNLQVVDKAYLRQMKQTYDYLFARDKEERDVFVDYSVSLRRTYSRKGKAFPVLAWDGSMYQVLPKTKGKLVNADAMDFKPDKTFKSQKAYRRAIKEWGGDPDTAPALPPRKRA